MYYSVTSKYLVAVTTEGLRVGYPTNIPRNLKILLKCVTGAAVILRSKFGHMHIGYACFFFISVHFSLFPVFDFGVALQSNPIGNSLTL